MEQGAGKRVRRDGQQTRLQILRAAGPVFADKGYASATSKEIAASAGVPPALVNYHFGSKERLYCAVLALAHSEFITLEEMRAVIEQNASPRAQMVEILTRIIGRIGSGHPDWQVRVFVRELAAPSGLFGDVFRSVIFPKVRLLRSVIAGAFDLEDEDSVRMACAQMMLPVLGLAIMPEPVRRAVLPAGASGDAFLRALIEGQIAAAEAVAGRRRAAG